MVDAKKALETSELDCAAGCGGKDGVKMADTFEGRVCMQMGWFREAVRSEICMKQHDLISEVESGIRNKENNVARQGDRYSYACKTQHGQVRPFC